MDTAERIVMNMWRQLMTTDVLTLAQWLSPAYPIGAYAYSHGLETMIADGTIHDAGSLQDWLTVVLFYGSGRTDCMLLHAAFVSENLEALAEIDAAARAFAPCAERLQETVLQGEAFCETTQMIWGEELPNLTYPVAVGYAAAQADLEYTVTAALFLQAFTSNLVSVATRAIPLGQTEGQAVLAALSPLCQSVAHDVEGSTLEDLASSTFLSDIAAMRHETLQPRIFRS